MSKMNFQWLRKSPEIPTLFLFFSFAVAETITYNFTMYRACLVDFGFNRTDCERLGSGDGDDVTSAIEEDVMPFVIQVLTVQELLVQVIPAVLGLFIGPWSDKNGRRPVMVATMCGMSIGGVISIIIVLTETVSVWFFLIPVIPMVIFGGVVPFLTAAFCYVIDITTEAKRGLRMGIFDGFMSAGTLIGTLLTSYLYEWGGYITVYIVIVACFFIAMLYNIFGLVESLKKDENHKMDIKVISLKNITDLVKVTFRRRGNNVTVILVLMILIGIVTKFSVSGAATVTYMFLVRKLNWGLQQYTIYRTLKGVLTIIMTVIGVYVLHKKLRIREAPLILGCSVFLLISMLITGWATEDWHIYLAGVTGSVGGFVGAMTATLISKLVEKHETGKVFSVLTVIQSLSLLGGLPLYMAIYNSTMNTSPGAFNFFTAGLFGLMIILITLILVIQRYSLRQDIIFGTREEPSKDEGEIRIPEEILDNKMA